MMRCTADARRVDGWWAVSVREMTGVFTQVRRLDQVEAMVGDAVRLMLGEPDLAVEVDVVPETPWSDMVAASIAARSEAETAAERAASLTRVAAQRLTEAGLSVRDAGRLLRVSPQRVSQLTN